MKEFESRALGQCRVAYFEWLIYGTMTRSRERWTENVAGR